MISGFLEMISRICVSPIFVISIDKFYQYLCIGEFCESLTFVIGIDIIVNTYDLVNNNIEYDIPFNL